MATLISVVIPLYNKKEEILKALRSVYAQSLTDYEIIIVDDGSTDGSAEVVEEFLKDGVTKLQGDKKPKIRLIRQENAGVSGARNRGIAEAFGEWIAFLDADDEWKPDYLATINDLMSRYPNSDVLATNYEFRSEGGRITPTILIKLDFKWKDGVISNYFEVASCSNPPLWTSAVCARKVALEAVGGFPTGVIQGEDLLTWAKLACRYRIAYSLKPMAIFNIEGNGRNGKPKRIPPEPDRVGTELLNLKKEYNPPYFDQYLSFWHKMRSALFWRLKERKKARCEALKALRFNPLNYKAYVLLALNLF